VIGPWRVHSVGQILGIAPSSSVTGLASASFRHVFSTLSNTACCRPEIAAVDNRQHSLCGFCAVTAGSNGSPERRWWRVQSGKDYEVESAEDKKRVVA
jgi:hypothetical protein